MPEEVKVEVDLALYGDAEQEDEEGAQELGELLSPEVADARPDIGATDVLRPARVVQRVLVRVVHGLRGEDRCGRRSGMDVLTADVGQ